MKSSRGTLSPAGWLLGLAAWLLFLEGRPLAQESAQKLGFSTSPDDKAACEHQLNILTGAIREYRKDHGNKPPDKLSDLTPDYIHDASLLTCPFVRKRGGLRAWRKSFRTLCSDPHTSYGYEFPSDPVPDDQWRGVPRKSWREVKERLIEELGPVVPIVRCHDHRPWLNLAVEGTIYESTSVYWEKNFSKDEHFLTIANLFTVRPGRPLVAADFPPREPRAGVRLLDLTGHYNATLTNSWQGFPGNHLASLPAGLQEFDGVRFDVRGVIQLHGTELPAAFPRQVAGIKVHQKCARIHFLHALSFNYLSGTTQAAYVVHYADGEAREFRVVQGQHIADWWRDPRKPASPTEARVAWTGQNEAARAYDMSLHLHHAVWENPLKDTEIATITFDALEKEFHAGPFVVAITLE
jgi:hypothetical protein